jgi:signal transduction histidine kinase
VTRTFSVWHQTKSPFKITSVKIYLNDVEQAYNSAQQLSELFRDILTVSEIDNDEVPHYEKKMSFDVTSVAEDVVRSFRPKADAKKIALTFSGHEHKSHISY